MGHCMLSYTPITDGNTCGLNLSLSTPRAGPFLWLQLRGCPRRQQDPGAVPHPGRAAGGRDGPQPLQAGRGQMEL